MCSKLCHVVVEGGGWEWDQARDEEWGLIITCFAGIQVDVIGDFKLVVVLQQMVYRVFWHISDESTAAAAVVRSWCAA